MFKNTFIVYKSENLAITVFLFKQMLKCLRNHINMYLTTESDYFRTAFTGVTKHRNGMERNGIYRNKPEYTGTRQNDAEMKRNGQEWYRNDTGIC